MSVAVRTETYWRPECAECERIAAEADSWDAFMINRLQLLDTDFDNEDDAEWAMAKHNREWHS